MSKSQDHKAFEAAINQFPPEKREKMRELVLKKLALQAQQKALLEGGLTYKDINEVDQHKNGIGFAMEQAIHTKMQTTNSMQTRRPEKRLGYAQEKEMSDRLKKRKDARTQAMKGMTAQEQREYLIAFIEKTEQEIAASH
jgi:hypothetical protein